MLWRACAGRAVPCCAVDALARAVLSRARALCRVCAVLAQANAVVARAVVDAAACRAVVVVVVMAVGGCDMVDCEVAVSGVRCWCCWW